MSRLSINWGRLVEKRIGLSAHTDNEVDSDESVGHDLFDMFDTSREELRVVASAHKAENLIATRLQGYVEVGGEMFRCGDEIDNFRRSVDWALSMRCDIGLCRRFFRVPV